MSIVLTLLCNNSTITTEVHSLIETQLYTFPYRNTSSRLDQQSETEFTQQPTNSSTMAEEQVTTCNLEKRVIFNSSEKIESCPPIVPVLAIPGRRQPPSRTIPLTGGTLAR